MIYIQRDPALIPERVLRVAERAQAQLEALPPEARSEFIEKKAHVWRAFGKFLSKMSYGKCWYSESECVQSFKDVDHFRPKKQAKRTKAETDGGYPWLAFSWDNFRLSAQRSNQISRNEGDEIAVGKGAWFPLLVGSPRATWNDRCVDAEKPVLLDPTNLADVRLIEVTSTGKIGPSKYCLGQVERNRVEESVRLLGLDLPGLVGARTQSMRLVQELVEQVQRTIEAADKSAIASAVIAMTLPIDAQLKQLRTLSEPARPYAAAVRAQLFSMGFGDLCAPNEQFGVAA